MMISPGYSYEKAPDQQHFLKRRATVGLFQRLLAQAPRRWRFNQSPLFLLFLQGRYDLECTPWGNPTYNLFGWQKPCYLMQEGYTQTFQELLDQTDWSQYGRASGNPKCADCMVHSGYEPSAVDATFGSLRGFLTTVKSVLLGTGGPAVAGSKHLPVVSAAEHLPVAEVVAGGRPASGARPQVELPVVQPKR
jgi:hypothetical protein